MSRRENRAFQDRILPRLSTVCSVHREPPSSQLVVYALIFDPYFRCAACLETPSIVPISDQLR